MTTELLDSTTCSIFVRCNPRVLLIHCSSSFRPLKFALFMPTTLDTVPAWPSFQRESTWMRMDCELADDAMTLVHKPVYSSNECIMQRPEYGEPSSKAQQGNKRSASPSSDA